MVSFKGTVILEDVICDGRDCDGQELCEMFEKTVAA